MFERRLQLLDRFERIAGGRRRQGDRIQLMGHQLIGHLRMVGGQLSKPVPGPQFFVLVPGQQGCLHEIFQRLLKLGIRDRIGVDRSSRRVGPGAFDRSLVEFGENVADEGRGVGALVEVGGRTPGMRQRPLVVLLFDEYFGVKQLDARVVPMVLESPLGLGLGLVELPRLQRLPSRFVGMGTPEDQQHPDDGNNDDSDHRRTP